MSKKGIIPECWEEVRQEQFEYLLKKVFKYMGNENISKEDVLNDFAHYLCGRKHYTHPVRHAEYMLLIHTAAKIMDWIFTEDENGLVIVNYNTTSVLIQNINNLIGPKDAGMDIRFGEYRKACWMYNSYTTEQDVKWLDGLVGILYRPKNKGINNNNFSGDYRVPFNEFLIGNYAKSVRNVPEYIKYGVYLWFGNFCRHIMEDEFLIDGQLISFAPIFGGDTDPDAKKDESLGMTSVLFTLAESGTFGNEKETDNALLFKVLLKLLSDHKTAKNLTKK